MIKSMTAFGRAKKEGEQRDITIEMRSVNSRFFDCTVKIPRAYAFLEERIKSYVQKNAVSRAKVDVFVTVNDHTSGVGSVTIDKEFVESYLSALRELSESYGLRDDISVMSVARNSDVFKYEKAEADLEAEWLLIKEVLDEAIAGYLSMREAEGDRIKEDIFAKLESVRRYSEEVEEISHTDTVGYRDKLEARLRQILSDNSVEIDKIAIDEELVRLRSHFGAFYEIAALPEPSGRKLDFLMQELNRETNTIGSKANNARIARIVVSMKGELEKMREQIQNIE